MSAEIVIRVSPDGRRAECLYTEAIDLDRLGAKRVTRASDVEFDNERGGWTVTLKDGTLLPGVYASRAEGISSEVEFLNAKLRQ